MKIINIHGTQAARVQAPLSLMRCIAKDPAAFPTTQDDPRLDDAILTVTDSKLYYQGGGWWYLVGYAYNGEDVSRCLVKLNTEHHIRCLTSNITNNTSR